MTTPMPQRTDVDLWYLRTANAVEPELLARYREILTSEEIARAEEFRFEKDQHQSLLTRALVRTVLSEYVDCEPTSLAFDRDTFGKPSLTEPVDASLSFNLSHTTGLIVLAVASGAAIGVDVEDASREIEHLTLAKRFFDADEAAAIEQSEQTQQAFFQHWTLKEAYVKACGRGLSIPLESFAFTLHENDPPTIAFIDDGDKPSAWQFASLRLDGRYQLAIAARQSDARPPAICVRETVPLVETSPVNELPTSPRNEWEI